MRKRLLIALMLDGPTTGNAGARLGIALEKGAQWDKIGEAVQLLPF